MEKVENVELFDGDKSKTHVIVNTEWGAFGDDGQLDTIRTKYDLRIDENSLNRGKQKYVSNDLGEFFSVVLSKYIPSAFDIFQIRENDQWHVLGRDRSDDYRGFG